MNINSINRSDKKRLYEELKKDNEEQLKLQLYSIKYPEFATKMKYFNLILLELENSKNNDTNTNININTNTNTNTIDRNKELTLMQNTLLKQIKEIKIEFQKYCVHKWITTDENIPKTFTINNHYDRESCYICSNCDFNHTISFYSK